MFQYLWLIILGIGELIWIGSVISDILFYEHFPFFEKIIMSDRLKIWAFVHAVILFVLSLGYYINLNIK